MRQDTHTHSHPDTHTQGTRLNKKLEDDADDDDDDDENKNRKIELKIADELPSRYRNENLPQLKFIDLSFNFIDLRLSGKCGGGMTTNGKDEIIIIILFRLITKRMI